MEDLKLKTKNLRTLIRRYKKTAIFLVVSASAISCNNAGENRSAKGNAKPDGGELFAINCSTCHKCDVDFQAPALKGALQRWNSKKEMYSFIHDPWGTIQKNDYAKKLMDKFNGVMMTPSTLSDDELDAIFEHCEKSAK